MSLRNLALALLGSILCWIVFIGTIFLLTRAPKPRYNGVAWSCPAGYQVVADQAAAMQGKDSAHCTR